MPRNSCSRCQDGSWVCENHPDKAWPKECECGAGMPCPDCREDIPDHDWYYKIMGGTCDRCGREQAICDERCNPLAGAG